MRVDLFLEPPFDFEQAHARRYRAATAPGLEISFVGFGDLVAMKRAAGRPQDLADLERLERIRRDDRES